VIDEVTSVRYISCLTLSSIYLHKRKTTISMTSKHKGVHEQKSTASLQDCVCELLKLYLI